MKKENQLTPNLVASWKFDPETGEPLTSATGLTGKDFEEFIEFYNDKNLKTSSASGDAIASGVVLNVNVAMSSPENALVTIHSKDTKPGSISEALVRYANMKLKKPTQWHFANKVSDKKKVVSFSVNILEEVFILTTTQY